MLLPPPESRLPVRLVDMPGATPPPLTPPSGEAPPGETPPGETPPPLCCVSSGICDCDAAGDGADLVRAATGGAAAFLPLKDVNKRRVAMETVTGVTT